MKQVAQRFVLFLVQFDRECKLAADRLGMSRLPYGLIIYLPCRKAVISKALYRKTSD